MFQKSKTGMLHKIDMEHNGKNLPKCQSYNLDRPNYLDGKIFETVDGHKKLCKKCF
jgi:hypothetical protein